VRRGQIVIELAFAAAGVFAVFAMGGGSVGLVALVITAAGAAFWVRNRVR
jgi:hypothetical protein